MIRRIKRKLLYIFKKELFYKGDFKVDISNEYKFIYHKTAKTGSTTISTMLGKSVKDVLVCRADHSFTRLKHEYDQYYHFAFVRNPWDRLVSCYRNTRGELGDRFERRYGKQNYSSMRFDDFVRWVDGVSDQYADMHFIAQYYTVNPKEMDFIGRYETFEVDLFRLLNIIIPDHKIEEIQHERKTNHDNKHYREYYTEETRDIVARKYKRDIELFNYQF